MGSLISAVRSNLGELSVEDERKNNDALTAMETIAQAKLKIFEEGAKSTSDNMLIPIDKIVFFRKSVMLSVTNDSQQIKGTIDKLLSGICGEGFLTALANVAKDLIDDMLGGYSGNQCERLIYKVVVGSLGGFRRLDAYVYSYQFRSKEMMTIAKNIFAVSIMVSSVDSDKLDIPTLKVLIEDMYGRDESKESLEKCKQLYEEIEGERRRKRSLQLQDEENENGKKRFRPVLLADD